MDRLLTLKRTARYIEEFLCILGTCHTVIPEINDDDDEDDEINYQASSPGVHLYCF